MIPRRCFLPHTVKQPRLHQFCHMSALRGETQRRPPSLASAAYAQTKLLQIFPELGPRSFRGPTTSIAPDYFPAIACAPARGRRHRDPRVSMRRASRSSGRPISGGHSTTAMLVVPKDFRFNPDGVDARAAQEPSRPAGGVGDACDRNPRRPPALVLVGVAPDGATRNLLRAIAEMATKGGIVSSSRPCRPPEMRNPLCGRPTPSFAPSVDEGFDLPGGSRRLCCGGAVAGVPDIPVPPRDPWGDAAAFFRSLLDRRHVARLSSACWWRIRSRNCAARPCCGRRVSIKSHTLRPVGAGVSIICRANETPHAGE